MPCARGFRKPFAAAQIITAVSQLLNHGNTPVSRLDSAAWGVNGHLLRSSAVFLAQQRRSTVIYP
jgi:hypothetical protein